MSTRFSTLILFFCLLGSVDRNSFVLFKGEKIKFSRGSIDNFEINSNGLILRGGKKVSNMSLSRLCAKNPLLLSFDSVLVNSGSIKILTIEPGYITSSGIVHYLILIEILNRHYSYVFTTTLELDSVMKKVKNVYFLSVNISNKFRIIKIENQKITILTLSQWRKGLM